MENRAQTFLTMERSERVFRRSICSERLIHVAVYYRVSSFCFLGVVLNDRPDASGRAAMGVD